jgi:hypothetical protein
VFLVPQPAVAFHSGIAIVSIAARRELQSLPVLDALNLQSQFQQMTKTGFFSTPRPTFVRKPLLFHR